MFVDRHRIPLGFDAIALVPAGPVVYAVGATTATVTVARIDVAAKTVTARRTFAGYTASASVGAGDLAVLTRMQSAATVRLLDPRTLATTAIRTFTLAADVLARSEATYVSTPGRILALDPTTLRTLRSIDVQTGPGDPGANIAADPRSHVMYAGIFDRSATAGPHVDVINLNTGRVVADPRVNATIVAYPQGYGDYGWLIFASGASAAIELLTSRGRELANTGQVGPNDSSIAVTSRHLWTLVPSASGRSSACRDLRTGVIQGSSPNFHIEPTTAADDTHVYTTDGPALLVYTPGGRCA